MQEDVRSDDGNRFTAGILQTWLHEFAFKTACIETGVPWETGFNESVIGSLHDEFLEKNEIRPPGRPGHD